MEGQTAAKSEQSYYEEPDTPRQLPPLQSAPVLRDLTNRQHSSNEPPTEIDRLDDLLEPPINEIEKAYGISLQDSTENSPLCGRGTRYTSANLTRM